MALIEGEGGRAIGLPVDVSDQQAIARAVADTELQLGPVDLLINKAGGGGQVGPLWDVEPDEWGRCVEVSLRAPLFGRLYNRAVFFTLLLSHRRSPTAKRLLRL